MGCLTKCCVYLIFILGLAWAETRLDKLQYVGCFERSYSISKNYQVKTQNINLAKCVDSCINLGYPRYIGIEASDNSCYCGGDIAKESTKKDDKQCSIKCSDGNQKTCGGDKLMSLYEPKTKVQRQVSESNVSVVFLVGMSTGIRVYNSSRLPNFFTLTESSLDNKTYTLDYHYAKKLVFTNNEGKLYSFEVSRKSGGVITKPALVRELSQCHGFAVDWVNNKIYWVDCQASNYYIPSIMVMNLDGTHNEKVITLGGDARSIQRMEVDPYSRILFWLGKGVVESLQLTSKQYHNSVSEKGVVVLDLALDRSAQKVYYIGHVVDLFSSSAQITSLFSMDYSGSHHLKIYSVPQMKVIISMAVHRGYVYWINSLLPADTIYSVPLEMEGSRYVKVVQTVDKPVRHMRVVDPELQKPPSVSPCLNKKCSHFCLALGTTSSVCQCPPLHELGADGITCS